MLSKYRDLFLQAMHEVSMDKTLVILPMSIKLDTSEGHKSYLNI